MSLYEKYANEEQFREHFIKPLLVKMGFIGITKKHGSNEFGKDYVFSELDRFGVMRNMAVQAKHEECINQGRKVDDLYSQIEQAFNVAYRLPSSLTEERQVSAVYVFNSGIITDNAITQIRGKLDRDKAKVTYFYDGHQLESLDKVIVRQRDGYVRDRTQALLRQITIDANILAEIVGCIDAYRIGSDPRWDGRRLLLAGVESYLTLPFFDDAFLLDEIAILWQEASAIERSYNRLLAPVVMRTLKDSDADAVYEMCRVNMRRCSVIVERLTSNLAALPAVLP